MPAENFKILVPLIDKKNITKFFLKMDNESSHQQHNNLFNTIMSNVPAIKAQEQPCMHDDIITVKQNSHYNSSCFSKKSQLFYSNNCPVEIKEKLNDVNKKCNEICENLPFDNYSDVFLRHQISKESLTEDSFKQLSCMESFSNELLEESQGSNETLGSNNSSNLPATLNIFCNRSLPRRGGRLTKKRTKYDAAYQEIENLGDFEEIIKRVDLSKVDLGSAAGEILRRPEKYSYECWKEGFTIRLGADGRRLLLRKLRAMYATNPIYWKNVLKSNDLNIKNLFTLATVPQIFKITHLMGREMWGFALKCACFTSTCNSLLQNDLELGSECNDELLAEQDYVHRPELLKKKVEKFNDNSNSSSLFKTNSYRNFRLQNTAEEIEQMESKYFFDTERSYDNAFRNRLQKTVSRMKTKQLIDSRKFNKTKYFLKSDEVLNVNCIKSRNMPLASSSNVSFSVSCNELKADKRRSGIYNESYKNNRLRAKKFALSNKTKLMNGYSTNKFTHKQFSGNLYKPSLSDLSSHNHVKVPFHFQDDLDLPNLTIPITNSTTNECSVSSNISDIFQRYVNNMSNIEDKLTSKNSSINSSESFSNNFCNNKIFPVEDLNAMLHKYMPDELFQMLATPVPQTLLIESQYDKSDINKDLEGKQKASKLNIPNMDLLENLLAKNTSGNHQEKKNSTELADCARSNGLSHETEKKQLESLALQYSLTTQYLQTLSLFQIQQNLMNILKKNFILITPQILNFEDFSTFSRSTIGCQLGGAENIIKNNNISDPIEDVKHILKAENTRCDKLVFS